jgi:hypothetical protein
MDRDDASSRPEAGHGELQALLELVVSDGFECSRSPSPYETMAVLTAPFDERGLRLARAAAFLGSHAADDDPPLWIGKTLYRSSVITRGQRLSALALPGACLGGDH